MQAINNFINNMNDLMRHKNLNNYSELSNLVNVNVNTLKCWMTRKRSISLKQLDFIADKLHIESYILIKKNGLDCLIEQKVSSLNNNSREILATNLNMIFIKNGKITWNEKESMFFGYFSTSAIMSYTRKRNYRTPPLNKIDLMAESLGVEVYTLIKDGAFK